MYFFSGPGSSDEKSPKTETTTNPLTLFAENSQTEDQLTASTENAPTKLQDPSIDDNEDGTIISENIGGLIVDDEEGIDKAGLTGEFDPNTAAGEEVEGSEFSTVPDRNPTATTAAAPENPPTFQGWKFMSCSHCQKLGQQASWLLIACTRVNSKSEARSAS